MYIASVTNDHDNITCSIYKDMLNEYDNMTLSNCTNNENNIDIILPTLLLIIPSGLSDLCLMSLMLYTLFKPLFNKQMLGKILYAQHSIRCIITGLSECGKSVFLTNLILKTINEYDKIYIYSPSLHQDLYQKKSNVSVIIY